MRLILNRHARAPSERFVSADQSPEAIRAAVRAIVAEWGEVSEDVDFDVVTFSGDAADTFMRQFTPNLPAEERFALVFVFDGERDRCVTEAHTVDWLCHFSVGDMYGNMEFTREAFEKAAGR